MKWTKEQRDLVSKYLEMGYTYGEIAKTLKLTYDQIQHVVKRYNLKDTINADAIFQKDKKKLRKDDITKLARILGEKIYENYSKISLPILTPVKCEGKREEMSILDIGDVHIGAINEVFDSKEGKKIVTYNMKIFVKELTNLQQSIAQIHEILSHSYNLKELTIFFLGDIVTNDRIFAEQVFEIEKVVGNQVFDAVSYFSMFINNLLALYEKINVIGVVGNHGRSNPTHYNEPVQNNFEYFVYKMIEKQFEDNNRVNVIVPETRRYIHKIYGWRHLIEHGDLIRGSSDASIEKQIKELSLNMGGFDVFHMAHLHKLKETEIADKIIVKRNGAWIEKDNYAFTKFKSYSVPKQLFFGCNKKRPETWHYGLDLRG